MALFNLTYTDPNGNTDLEDFLTQLVACVNALDNDNIRPAAGIAQTKVENGAYIETHADRHAAGGVDGLPVNSINSAMIGERVINSHHIGLGAIQAIHLAEGAITNGIYIDTAPTSYSHGDVPTAPEGYDAADTVCLIVGIHLPANDSDRGCRGPIDIYCVVGESVQCQMYQEDDSNAFQGSIDVIRIAFK